MNITTLNRLENFYKNPVKSEISKEKNYQDIDIAPGIKLISFGLTPLSSLTEITFHFDRNDKFKNLQIIAPYGSNQIINGFQGILGGSFIHDLEGGIVPIEVTINNENMLKENPSPLFTGTPLGIKYKLNESIYVVNIKYRGMYGTSPTIYFAFILSRNVDFDWYSASKFILGTKNRDFNNYGNNELTGDGQWDGLGVSSFDRTGSLNVSEYKEHKKVNYRRAFISLEDSAGLFTTLLSVPAGKVFRVTNIGISNNSILGAAGAFTVLFRFGNAGDYFAQLMCTDNSPTYDIMYNYPPYGPNSGDDIGIAVIELPGPSFGNTVNIFLSGFQTDF